MDAVSASVGRDRPTSVAVDIAAVDAQTVSCAVAAFVSVVPVASVVDPSAPLGTFPAANYAAVTVAFHVLTDALAYIRAAERVFAAARVHSAEPFSWAEIENHSRAASSLVPVPVLAAKNV